MGELLQQAWTNFNDNILPLTPVKAVAPKQATPAPTPAKPPVNNSH
jgi:hypothetical protein